MIYGSSSGFLDCFFIFVPFACAVALASILRDYFVMKDNPLLGTTLMFTLFCIPLIVGFLYLLNDKEMYFLVLLMMFMSWWVIGFNLIVETVVGFSFYKYFIFEKPPAWNLFGILLVLAIFVFGFYVYLEDKIEKAKTIKDKSRDNEDLK